MCSADQAGALAEEFAYQPRVFRDDFGLARFGPDVARLFFVAAFVVPRVELFADFAAVLRLGADLAALAGTRLLAVELELLADFVLVFRFGAALDLFRAAFAGARFLAVGFFARLFRAAMTAPETAPITVPTTGVPTAVPTTAPATAPPRVLLAAPFSSPDNMSFLSSSVMVDLPNASRLQTNYTALGTPSIETVPAGQYGSRSKLIDQEN